MKTTVNNVPRNVKEAHAALLEELGKLELIAATNSPQAFPALRSRLADAHILITEHFRSEEENGFMKAIQESQPCLKRDVQHLVNEHSRLMQWLDALIAQATAAGHMNESIRAGVRRWLDKVRDHETQENKLVEDAFLVDVGSGD
jgi:hypothetical protein